MPKVSDAPAIRSTSDAVFSERREPEMRVLIVTSMYPTETSYTGIFVAEQVRSLRAARVNVDVLSFNVGKTRLNYVLSFPRLFRAIRANGYGLVHTHHTYSFLLVDLARRLARTRVPIVLTNHEGEVFNSESRARTWHPTSWFRHSLLLKRLAARRADFVIFVSQQLASAVSGSDRQAVIPCGIDLDKFKPLDRLQCRKILGLPPDHVVIFFPASPTAKGKWFALAKAAYEIVRKRFPGSLLLTGGSIPYDSMPVYYNAADVVLQSSFYEASPTVVKESLACEIPLVSTDSGDTREIVEGVSFCFVCGNDSRELAGRILECLGHRALNGRQRLLREGLSLEQVARKIIGVYERLLGGGKCAC